MSTIKIPQNGLPQEISSIPFGQVFVLTDPEQGITSTIATQIQAIISIAGKLGQAHIVYALPVQNPELWGCFICKVKTEEGALILVSEKDSLLEMLCEFWGLDYKEVSKNIELSQRYERYVAIGGESHPLRVPVPAIRKPEKEETEVGSTLLQCITVHTKEKELAKIEEILEECALYGIDIDPYELMDIHKKVGKKERKTYELKIKIDKGKENEGKNGVWAPRRTCDIWLIDSAGKEYPIELNAQLKALYLTFILYNNGDGIKLSDIKTNDEFYNIFKHICERLRSVNNIPSKEELEKEVRGKRNKIKKAISNDTNGDKTAEMRFGIEGEEGKEYRVAGSTDDHRADIKEKFGIE